MAPIKLTVCPDAFTGSILLITACSAGLCFSVPHGVPVPPSLRNVRTQSTLWSPRTDVPAPRTDLRGNQE